MKKTPLGKQSFDSFGDLFQFKKSTGFFVKLAILFVAIGGIITFSSAIYRFAMGTITTISSKTAQVVSEVVGKDMIMDENGNINVLLIGMGGAGHAGGTLADTIIVASYNPKYNSVSMVSVPRDLYVYEKDLYAGRVNSVFSQQYSFHQGDLGMAAQGMAKKMSDILGITIPYYGIIDFKGFEKLIDVVGGLEIDVPYQVYDTTYPGETTYTTFRLDAGLQTLDGSTALKYARSRHSTSDFDRSQRQQIIIQAFIDKVSSKGFLTSASSIQSLYTQVSSMVVTNVEAEEVLGLIKYVAGGKPQIHRFGLTMECNDLSWKTMQAGCLLYPGVREDFGGMSILLPRGATARAPNAFEYTKFFGYMVMDNQGYLTENAHIVVENGIDDAVARKYRYRNGLASSIAGKLIRYGFTIDDVKNAEIPTETTTLVLPYGTSGQYDQTIKMLRLFLDIAVKEGPAPVIDNIAGSGDIADGSDTVLGEGKEGETDPQSSQPHLRLVLGTDFIDRFGKQRFDMYMKEE